MSNPEFFRKYLDIISEADDKGISKTEDESRVVYRLGDREVSISKHTRESNHRHLDFTNMVVIRDPKGSSVEYIKINPSGGGITQYGKDGGLESGFRSLEDYVKAALTNTH